MMLDFPHLVAARVDSPRLIHGEIVSGFEEMIALSQRGGFIVISGITLNNTEEKGILNDLMPAHVLAELDCGESYTYARFLSGPLWILDRDRSRQTNVDLAISAYSESFDHCFVISLSDVQAGRFDHIPQEHQGWVREAADKALMRRDLASLNYFGAVRH